MKILLICSKQFYNKIEGIKTTLEKNGNQVFLPNCYDAPETEQKMWDMGREEHCKFKAQMFRQSYETISNMDAVLVLNYDKQKNGETLKNYIGGATFLEMYEAFKLNKKIFMINEVPNNILADEIYGFNPIILNGDLSNIK